VKKVVRIEIHMTIHDPDDQENAYKKVSAEQASGTPDGLLPEDLQSISDQMVDAILLEEGFIEVTRRETK